MSEQDGLMCPLCEHNLLIQHGAALYCGNCGAKLLAPDDAAVEVLPEGNWSVRCTQGTRLYVRRKSRRS